MKTEWLLRKLEPLMPKEVRRWQWALDLADPELRALLEREIVATAHRRLGDFRRRLLLSLPPREKAKGALHLGTVLYDGEKWPAGLHLSELLQNAAIFGRSGAGKTNVTFHLLEQLAERRIPFLFLDWKRTGRHLLPRLARRIPVFTPGRALAPFPFNPFVPPPGLEPRVYANHVVDVLGDAYTLGDAARSVLQRALRACIEDGVEAPTVAEVRRRVEALPEQERVRGWKASALRALDTVAALDLAGGGVSQTAKFEALLRRGAIVELDALAPSNKKFLLPLLCLWVYYLKLPDSRREHLDLVIVVEEAHHLLYRRDADRESLMEQLLRQCREIGIGIVVVDQHPHLISSAALGNTYASICLNLKDPVDISKAAALSLMEEEKEQLSLLPVGQGVVKLQDRWQRPFLVQFPLIPVAKGAVTDNVLASSAASEGGGTLSAAAAPARGESGDGGRFRLGAMALDEEDLRFVSDVLSHPGEGVDQRYQRLGVSGEKGHRLKQRLLRGGVVEEQVVAVGRTRRVLLRVTTQARDALGLDGAAVRGSLAHEYWKRWYAARLEERGFRVWVEAPRGKGRVDVLGTRASESVAVEVETGRSDVVWNVRQDLLSGFCRVVVVATTAEARQRVEEELARAGLVVPRVSVVLRDQVGDAQWWAPARDRDA